VRRTEIHDGVLHRQVVEVVVIAGVGVAARRRDVARILIEPLPLVGPRHVEFVEQRLGLRALHPPPNGVVAPERMALELMVVEDALVVGMAREPDPVLVPHLALVPVGGGPQHRGGGHLGGVLIDRHHEPHARAVLQ
jgi:hypothetical protein